MVPHLTTSLTGPLLDLEQQEVVTATDRTSAYIQLYKALGGGWSPL